MVAFSKGRYVARMAQGAADVAAAHRLRARGFPGAPDADVFDDICRHVLVEDRKTGRLVCCYRFLPLACGREIGRSYSAQFYDLSALGAFDGPMVEMGRFCLDPETRDPDAVRVAWGAMTRSKRPTRTSAPTAANSSARTTSARLAAITASAKSSP